VEVEVEVGLVVPLGRGEPPERRDDPLAEPGDLADDALHPGPEHLVVHGPVEHGDVGERGEQVRILLEVPHQRFRVGHPPRR
jgi:hypothetical protein